MSVTYPQGFRAAGVAAGLKSSGAADVAVVISEGPRWEAAGVFTSNRIQAAPVLWSRQVLTDGRLRAVVLNSGGANACTGPEGFADTHHTAEAVAEALGSGRSTSRSVPQDSSANVWTWAGCCRVSATRSPRRTPRVDSGLQRPS